jgi:hypothetical protein
MIKWLRRREVSSPRPRRAINTSLLELQEAKAILAEIFHVRPAEVEEMIQRRMEEITWQAEQLWPEGI